MIIYKNDFSNYPSGTNLSDINFKLQSSANLVGTEISGIIRKYNQWGINAITILGINTSGSMYAGLINSSTPTNFTLSARASLSGNANYSAGSNNTTVRLFWDAKILSGTYPNSAQSPVIQGYEFLVSEGATNITFRRTDATGTGTIIDQDSRLLSSLVNVTDFTIKVVGSGNLFQCYLDNTIVASGTDATVRKNGIWGVGARPGVPGNNKATIIGNLIMDNNLPQNFEV